MHSNTIEHFNQLSGGKFFLADQLEIGGEIAHHCDLTVNKILHHLDIKKDFASHFLAQNDECAAPGGFVGYGMLLDAMVKAAYLGIGDQPLRELLDNCLNEILQKQHEDGNLSIFSASQVPGEWNSHEQSYLVQAFLMAHELLGNQQALAGAIRLGDYMIEHFQGITLGMESAFLRLYKQSGEKRFLDFCLKELALNAPLSEYDKMLCVNSTAHVYTTLARVLARLELQEMLPEYDDGLTEARMVLSKILDGGYASVTGAIAGGAGFGEIWDRSQFCSGKWGETCATAYLLRLLAKVAEFENVPRNWDLFERAMYNSLFAAQSADGLKLRYHVPLNEPGEWYPYDTYCCPNNFKRIMFELPRYVFQKAADGIIDNLYLPSQVKDGDTELTITTDYPEKETAVITCQKSGEYAIYLRIPLGCKNFTVTLPDGNGSTTASGEPGTYLKIRRQWQSGDRLTVSMALPIRLVRGFNAQIDHACFLRGPLVYGTKSHDNGCFDVFQKTLTLDSGQAKLEDDGSLAVQCYGQRLRHEVETYHLLRFSSEERFQTYLLCPEQISTEIDPLLRH